MKKFVYGFLIFVLVAYGLLSVREGSYTADTNVVIDVVDSTSKAYVPAKVSVYPHLKTPKNISSSGKGHYIFSLGDPMPALVVIKANGYKTKIRVSYLKPDQTTIFTLTPKMK